jgi:endo-1,4-beta-D-glucanase Y
VLYGPQRGFAPDPETGATGSYDAIRVYLWLGMEPSRAEPRALLRSLPQLPERIDARTLRAQGNAPVGFYGALLPDALQDPALRDLLLQRLDAENHDGLYGSPPRYYDQNLILFGRGFAEGRFHFTPDGALAPAWERQCFGSTH